MKPYCAIITIWRHKTILRIINPYFDIWSRIGQYEPCVDIKNHTAQYEPYVDIWSHTVQYEPYVGI